jgi:hypothetical protein
MARPFGPFNEQSTESRRNCGVGSLHWAVTRLACTRASALIIKRPGRYSWLVGLTIVGVAKHPDPDPVRPDFPPLPSGSGSKNPFRHTPTEDLERKFPKLFNGVGKLKDHQVKLFIDESVKPVAQMNRRIPFHLQTAVEKELKQMLADDIIEPVTGPVSWVSPLVIVNKPRQPGKIRICVDNRAANTAILRQRHVMPTLDDLIHQLNGSRMFSKLDLRHAFLQLELEPNSRYITTFSSHIGLFRYKRLNFGLSVSSELFQSTLSQILSPIAGRVINVCDDILVYAPSVHERDIALETVAKKLAECGLTLHKEKSLLNQSPISFYGCLRMVFLCTPTELNFWNNCPHRNQLPKQYLS